MAKKTVYEYRTPCDRKETEKTNRMLAQIFGSPPFAADSFLGAADVLGRENYRIAKTGRDITAALGVVPMAHFFHGRRVPTAGVTTVGVRPERRGRGAGGFIMAELVREMRKKRVPLSTLFPATLSMYRSAGYERAGSRYSFELDLKPLKYSDYTLEMEQASPKALPRLKKVQAGFARRYSGALEWHDFVWQYVLHDRAFSKTPLERFVFIVSRGKRDEGLIVFSPGHLTMPMTVHYFCAVTPEALKRILTFLSDQRSLVPKAKMLGSPADPLIHLLPEKNVTVTDNFPYMLRIVHLADALRKRGYPPGVEAELHLEVEDELLGANSGRYVLKVSGGKGTVKKGGTGALSLGIRDLAAMYTGFMTARELSLNGNVRGGDASLDAAAAVFAGPTPYIPVMF